MEREIFENDELSLLRVQGDCKSAQDKPAPKGVTFKQYSTYDNYLFPPSTNDYLPKTHIARFISRVIDRVGVGFLIDKYKGGGASAYHPAMMLKVWILGCIYRIFSSRKLEQALRENIAFIWISGNQQPDFRTLNNFRLLLEDDIKEVFRRVLHLCMDFGFIDSAELFLDHTKMEANANRHKITWRKSVERRLEKYEQEIDDLFRYINEVNLREDHESKSSEDNEWDEKVLDHAISLIQEQMRENQREKDEGREIKKALRRAKEVLKKQEQNQERLHLLGNRNSYSNTDPDATAMMQKDKVLVKPSYNEGIAVNNGFIVNFEVSHHVSDGVNFIDLMKGVQENLGENPYLVHTDGAYGSEENMAYLEEEEIGNYLKYSTYRREKSTKWHQEQVRKEDFHYEQEHDRYRCPRGNYLHFCYEREKTTVSGYRRKVRRYQASEQDCIKCPFKPFCTTTDRRGIDVSPTYERLKEQARNNLESEKGKDLRRRRGFEVESVFGDKKENNQRRRFLLRGRKRVLIESGIYYTSHNLRKLYGKILSTIEKMKSTGSWRLNMELLPAIQQ